MQGILDRSLEEYWDSANVPGRTIGELVTLVAGQTSPQTFKHGLQLLPGDHIPNHAYGRGLYFSGKEEGNCHLTTLSVGVRYSNRYKQVKRATTGITNLPHLFSLRALLTYLINQHQSPGKNHSPLGENKQKMQSSSQKTIRCYLVTKPQPSSTYTAASHH